MGFLPQPHGETICLSYQIWLGAIVGEHAGNNLVSNAHASCLGVTVVTHDINQRLVASVTCPRFHSVQGYCVGESPGTGDLQAIRIDFQHYVGTRDAVIAMNEGIHDSFADHTLGVLPGINPLCVFYVSYWCGVTPNEVPRLFDETGFNDVAVCGAQRNHWPA